MSLIRRLTYALIVLATGCTSTTLVMSLVDPAQSALPVRIGYCSGLVVSIVLAAALFVVATRQPRRQAD